VIRWRLRDRPVVGRFAGLWHSLAKRATVGKMAEPEFDQDRFNELVFYIAHKTKDDRRFGRATLAKVLYYSDFDSWRDAGQSISGATYIRMPFGPFPKQLQTAEEQLVKSKRAVLDYDVPEHVEKKIIPYGAPRPDALKRLGENGLFVIGRYIEIISEMMARQVSDQTHREPGWILAAKTGAEIPYGAAFLPDAPPTDKDVERAKRIARERGWLTDSGWQWERNPA
jgi:Protein of unknown function (DUF4065)